MHKRLREDSEQQIDKPLPSTRSYMNIVRALGMP